MTKVRAAIVTRISFYFALGLLVASAVAAYRTTQALIASNAWVDHTHRVLENLAEVLSLLGEAEGGQRGYIITGYTAYIASYSTSTTQIESRFDALRTLLSDNSAQLADLSELENLAGRRLELLEQGIHLRDTQGFEAAQRLVLSNTGLALMDEIRETVANMEAEEEALLSTRTVDVQRIVRSTTTFILGGTVLSVGVLLTIFLVLRNEVRQRRRTEAALASESSLLHILMDTLPDTIYFKDTASRFTRINRSQAKVLGVADVRHALGKTDLDFQPVELAQSFIEEEKRIFQTGRALVDRVEYNPTPDGQPRWFSSTKLPIVDEAGATTGLVGISRDITQRVKIEEALQQANDRLTQSFAALEAQSQGLAALNALLDLLATAETTQEAYGIIARAAQRLLPAKLGVLYMLNASRNLVEAVAVWGEGTLPPDQELLQPGDCWALRRGHVHGSHGPAGDAVCRHVGQEVPHNYVCLPMAAHSEALGLLHLRLPDGAAEQPAGGPDYTMATALADHLALALANLKLREKLRVQAIRDPLTGLFNRRYMEESLERELVRADRRGSTFGLIMMDLDHFKRFNDTFGHSAGDALLRTFGDYVRRSVRGEDIACRYGGEEFVLVLADANLEQATLRAQQVLAGVARLAVEHQGQPLGAVTISMGLAVFPDHGRSTGELLRAADEALYRAKAEGRARLVVAGA